MAVQIEGLNGIIADLNGLIEPASMREAMGQACSLVEAAAKKKAPKDTGQLRNSIKSRIDVESGEIVGVVYTPLEYAPYVEYGTGLFAENGGRADVPWNYQDDEGKWHKTRGQKPQPFLRPALDENANRIIEILGESIRQ